MSAKAQKLSEFQVLGRMLPSEKDPNPTVYKMQLFASDAVRARSKFWYFLRKLKRVKRVNGQVIAVHKVLEKNPNIVKNYGVWIRYDSRSGTHNMYKEYRDVTLVGAIAQMYSEMSGRHRARRSSIQIIRTAIVGTKDIRRPHTWQFIKDKIKFPMPDTVLPRPSAKRFKTVFQANRPNNSAF
jgi:large subunit ribosomal protein L18Ae